MLHSLSQGHSYAQDAGAGGGEEAPLPSLLLLVRCRTTCSECCVRSGPQATVPLMPG